MSHSYTSIIPEAYPYDSNLSQRKKRSSSIPIQPKMKRQLKARHLEMIAIGGTIGTGLFVASGESIATAGPLGAVFAYLLVGVMVYFVGTFLLML